MRYDTDSCAVELSALELCSLTLREGDLDGRPLGAGTLPRDDKELFYKLQSEAGAYYAPDVELCNTAELDGIYYTVTAVADGVIRKNGNVTVDKIRCVRGKGAYSQPDSLTLGLLRCAAYFLCVKEDREVVDGRVSYYDTDRKKLKYFNYRFMRSSLKTFYLDLLKKIEFRARVEVERRTVALASAENARFPYGELREGQESMIRECYSAIKRGKRIFIEAPTGTGKTISALFPAVRALGKGYCDKIFYLTPKTATRREAFLAASRLHSTGTRLRTVMITAKEQACLNPLRGAGVKDTCHAATCERCGGYYDRVDSALREMLDNYYGYSRSLILEMAKKYRVCPYELSLDLSELCDIIICDYNYAFDPTVYFRRYFGSEGRAREERYVFLIDEAHNLADRAREMYSAELSLAEIESLTEGMPPDDMATEELRAMLAPVASAIRGVRRLCKDDLFKDAQGNERGFYIGSSTVESIDRALEAFTRKSGEWLKGNRGHPLYTSLTDMCARVRKYITVSEYFDSCFKFYAQIADGDIRVRLYCLDPSEIMDQLLTRSVSSVMFSATLTPPEYFCDVLGGGKSAEKLSLPSPFAPENLCVAVADYVNTRFDAREDNAKRFATVIAASVTSRPGNYIAYFPSYSCLEQTYRAFIKKYPKVETVVQKKFMSAREREEFLAAFKDDTGYLRIGFCVLGGVFSEGVDLPGSRLIGSVIFGVGLPGLSNEKNIIKEHFDIKSDDNQGYDYAYTFPGMNNVLQAAGRVIRTSEDRGIVVLADDRYATPKYRTLFPKHWQNVKYAGNASSLAEIIRRFWENQD